MKNKKKQYQFWKILFNPTIYNTWVDFLFTKKVSQLCLVNKKLSLLFHILNTQQQKLLKVIFMQKSTSSSNGVQQGATSKEHNPRKSSKRKNRWLWRRSGTEKQEKDVATNDDTKTSSILQTSFNGFNFYQSETKSNYYYMINCSNSHSSRVANQSPRSTLLKLIHQSESSLFT